MRLQRGTLAAETANELKYFQTDWRNSHVGLQTNRTAREQFEARLGSLRLNSFSKWAELEFEFKACVVNEPSSKARLGQKCSARLYRLGSFIEARWEKNVLSSWVTCGGGSQKMIGNGVKYLGPSGFCEDKGQWWVFWEGLQDNNPTRLTLPHAFTALFYRTSNFTVRLSN